MKQIVILGAGTGGTIVANMLCRKLDAREWKIIVIDEAEEHVYQPGLIFLPFRMYGYDQRDQLVQPISKALPKGAEFVRAKVEEIEHQQQRVITNIGAIDYDWLVCSLGCHIAPETIDGLAEALGENVYTFYQIDHAIKMQNVLAAFQRGKLVIEIAEMPIKCPVAPIEFAFLADNYFTQQDKRPDIDITLVTPYAGAFTKPNANRVLSRLANEKGINIVSDFSLQSVDAAKKQISSFDGRSQDYDLLVVIPPNLGPDVIRKSGLGTDTGYAMTDPRTLKSKKASNIYFLGDNTNVTTSKAGSVTHFESETLVHNLLKEIAGEQPAATFDGHANCYIETGYDKAMLIDFNYDAEPIPGKFPLPYVGPFSLLEETHINHIGKLAFRWVYWNLLLPGYLPMVPLLPSHMNFLGKDINSSGVMKNARDLCVADLMTKEIVSVPQGSPMSDAIQLMLQHRISGLPVIDENAKPVGILTEGDIISSIHFSAEPALERDIRSLLSRRGKTKPMGTIVDDLMSTPPITIHSLESALHAIHRMESSKVKRLLVTSESSELEGIITRADLIKIYRF